MYSSLQMAQSSWASTASCDIRTEGRDSTTSLAAGGGPRSLYNNSEEGQQSECELLDWYRSGLREQLVLDVERKEGSGGNDHLPSGLHEASNDVVQATERIVARIADYRTTIQPREHALHEPVGQRVSMKDAERTKGVLKQSEDEGKPYA